MRAQALVYFKVASLSGMKKKLFGLIFFFTSIAFALLICEISVRLLYPLISNYNLEMWRYAKDMKMPLNKINLPFHHYPNAAGDFYGVEIKTNDIGFRDKGIDVKKTKKRILFVGDSFTLGWGVKEDSTFTRVLEKILRTSDYDYEVINSGIGNYNSRMECELFKWKGIKTNPDIVILMFFANDAEPVPEVSPLQYSMISKSYLFALLFDRIQKIKVMANADYRWDAYYKSLYRHTNPGLKDNMDALGEIAVTCRKRNIPLLFVNIPVLHQLKDYPLYEATKFIESASRNNGTHFLDLLPAIEAYPPKTLWVSPEDAHANGKANIIFGKEIFRYLKENKLIEKE